MLYVGIALHLHCIPRRELNYSLKVVQHWITRGFQSRIINEGGWPWWSYWNSLACLPWQQILSPKLHPQSDHIITNQVKLYVWICPGTTSQNTHLTSKVYVVISAVLALKKNLFNTPPLKPTKTETSFRKLNSLPTKLHMLFSTHLQARKLSPQTYSLSLPLEWSHTLA